MVVVLCICLLLPVWKGCPFIGCLVLKDQGICVRALQACMHTKKAHTLLAGVFVLQSGSKGMRLLLREQVETSIFGEIIRSRTTLQQGR